MKTLLRVFVAAICVAGSSVLVGQNLVHYWNFNNSNSEAELLTPSASLVPGASIQHIPGGTSAIQTASNTGQGFDNMNLNARNGDEAGTHLRFNTPIGGTLLFALPTTGYQQVVVNYTTRRSGSGAGTQIIEYTTDALDFDTLTTLDPVDGDPTLQTLDFSGIVEANDNASFQVRITFLQGPGGDAGNNRFDNFTVDAAILGSDVTPPVGIFTPDCDALDIAADIHPTIEFNEDIRLINDAPLTPADLPSVVELRKDSVAGDLVSYSGTYENSAITLIPDNTLESGTTYFIVLLAQTIEDTSNNAIAEQVACSFTTIRPQTIFAAGDIVPIAYRMNSSDAADEISLLTFVDILPGTLIRLTDAKYTTNPQPQCPGGIIWTSPDKLLPKGSVFNIGVDEGTASTGTVDGSTFGLSSNGDQVIVYTGAADVPAHIMALSSNLWVTGDHTACNGSNSLIPAGLTDGITAINLSTAPGNTSGNTVNAYYSGPQIGSDATLHTLILDPANWNGIEAGTPAQIWPEFIFPQPPVIIDAWVVNHTQLRVAYDHDMDPATTTDLANYTGIADLQDITMTNNGDLADTVTLTFGAPFVNGNSYSLTIEGVKDVYDRSTTGSFTFDFDYITMIGFEDGYLSVEEGIGTATIALSFLNPSDALVTAHPLIEGFSTATEGDFTFTTVEIGLDGTSAATVTFDVQITDDQLAEQDEYLVLQLESLAGATIDGSQYFTLYIRDNDRPAPVPTEDIALTFVSRYTVDNPDTAVGLAEIVAYDPISERLFTMSTGLEQFDIIDFSNPLSPNTVAVIDISAHGNGITSVAAHGGVIAVTVTGLNNKQENGSVLFYNSDGVLQNQVQVGALPDMLTFTADGHYVLVANEGQPSDDYLSDPEGSVSIIDMTDGVSNINQSDVATVTFTAFNDDEAELIAAGVRKLQATSTLSQDFEPEYLTVSKDLSTVWVTLQENNAIAELDLSTKQFTSVWPLGLKDFNAFGNGLDLSDRNDFVHLSNWPLYAFYAPDAIANYVVDNTTYLVTANEGDEREYTALNERTTVGAVVLDSTLFPNAEVLQANHNMGRFRITNLHGDPDGDGDFDQLFSMGGRSFSIWNAETGERVWDSGDAFELITSTFPHTAPIFNADNANNDFKGRSRAKGPEPEGVIVARLNEKFYAFVTLERIGGVMVYDISDPTEPEFTDYINTRDNTTYAGDNGPEGVLHVAHRNGNHYILTANELSGTVAVYAIANVITDIEQPSVTSRVALYPNPASDKVFFNGPQSFDVIDVNGKVIFSDSNASSMDVSKVTAGMYLVRFANGEVQKLVVE